MVFQDFLSMAFLFLFFHFALPLPALLSAAAAALIVLAGHLPGLAVEFYRRSALRATAARDTWVFLRRVSRALIFLVVLVLLKGLWTLAVLPRSFDDEGQKAELLARRTYLLQEVATPRFSASRMPAIFPPVLREEWGIGTLSMTTAALTNLAFIYPETRQESLAAVKTMIDKVCEPEFLRFEVRIWGADPLESLPTENGQIGYLGHLNWMLAAYRLLGGGAEYAALHAAITEALARRMQNRAHAGYYLETFPGAIAVPDNMVVVASIALYDRIYGSDHQELIANWLKYTRQRLVHPEYGVIYPRVDMEGRGFGTGRGIYAAWNLVYLPFIDRDFAREEWLALKRNFMVTLPFGLSAVREYPHGEHGSGDLDSGPVIFGLSTAGSGFALAGARFAGDTEAYRRLVALAEFVGTSAGSADNRRYLAAPLVGDAIMLTVRTVTAWDERFLRPTV